LKEYQTDLERKWAAVKKVVKGGSLDRQLEIYQAFLTEFPVDNPYAEKARKEVSRLDEELTRKAETDADEAAKAAKLAVEKRKAELMRQAYELAKNAAGSTRERLSIWQRFIEAYPGNDNPYLSTAKREIATLEKENSAEKKKQVDSEARKETAASPAGVASPAEVLQPGTNLYWLRCPLGQKWSSSSCNGNTTKLKWTDATSSCPSGYRLPTREEFVDLLSGCNGDVYQGKAGKCRKCAGSEICRSLFASDTGWYWASTAAGPTYSWFAFFSDGRIDLDRVANFSNVRCVRQGP
jgi:hypothetical protein